MASSSARMTRRTPDNITVLLICLKRELNDMDAAHQRMWKAADRACKGEPA